MGVKESALQVIYVRKLQTISISLTTLRIILNNKNIVNLSIKNIL